MFAQSAQKTESFWEKVLRIAGVSSNPTALRGGEKTSSGDVWIAPAVAKPVLQRLTRDGGFSSPVFDARDQSVFVLKGGDLYRVPLEGGSPARVHSLPAVTKLVGISRDDPDQLLVLAKSAQSGSGVALMSVKTGALTAVPFNARSNEDQMMLAHLAGWERVFGDVRLYCEDEEKEAAGGSTIRFTDVYLKRGSDPPINLTNGDGISSCQPSLSTDGKRVVFIRAPR